MEYNGRLSNIRQTQERSYTFYSESSPSGSVFKKEAIKGYLQENPLSDLFFSKQNIDALHQGIRYMVYNRTKVIIGKQSDVELQVIMRSIYLQYSKNMPFDIVGQVRSLNQRVLDYAVPQIVTEVNQYNKYLNDISKLPVPMERSKNVSSAGTKFLYVDKL